MGLLDKLFGPGKPAKPASIDVETETGGIYAPVSGTVEPMASIPDVVFSSGAMGPCLGIWPEEGIVYAPVSGVVTAAMPHAFGFVGDDGVEVLIHVGVNTVEMKGDGFIVHVDQGERVAAGEAILSFDKAKVADAGHPDIVIVVIINDDAFTSVSPAEQNSVTAGSELFHIR